MSNNKLTDDDKDLFRTMMQNVKPLDKTKKADIKPQRPSEKPIKKVNDAEQSTTHYNLSNYYTADVSSDSILTYCKQSIPRKRLTELKSGQTPWQARLDLHGLRPDNARDALCQFIEQQCNIGNRCLLVIHGKGGLRGEAPVLKNHVNHWLQQMPQILAFHSALPRDGGCGALYVLLQRQREGSY